MTPALFGFPEARDLATATARALGVPCLKVAVRHFPDGESLVRVAPEPFAGRAIVLRSLADPNRTLVELLLALGTLRRRGAREVWLVAPYLCYMRQDAEFEPGQAVSQALVAGWIGREVDRLYTFDAHLHRTRSLEALFRIPARNLSAAPLIAGAVRAWGATEVLGPDEESRQWCAQVAAAAGARLVVARKQRRGDREVTVTLPEGLDLAGRRVAVVDDLASTGGSLVALLEQVRRQRPAGVRVFVTHALLGPADLDRLRAAGADAFVSTNSVPHPTNRLDLAPLLAEALAADLREGPLGGAPEAAP